MKTNSCADCDLGDECPNYRHSGWCSQWTPLRVSGPIPFVAFLLIALGIAGFVVMWLINR